MMEHPVYPGEGATFSGECDGPVGESCGEQHRRHFPIDKAPENTFIRFRCPDCDAIAVLTKEQT